MSMEEELAKRLEGFNGRQAKVGWFESARYTEDGQDISVAEVAIIQEFGAPGANIPPRPFIRPTFNAQKEKWTELIEKGVKAVMRGATTADAVLDTVGHVAAEDIKMAIRDVTSPELAESTKEQRRRDGFTDEPLNRTGYMIATCTRIVGNVE